MIENGDAGLVVRDGLAARQWEAYLLRESILEGRRVSISPPLLPLGSWLAELWSQSTDAARELLSRAQSRALWRRVIASSTQAPELIDTMGPAAWAADAWRLLAASGLDPAELRAARHEPDFEAFLDWCRGYRRRLADAHWMDSVDLELELARLPPLGPRVVGLLDLTELTPLQTRLFARLADNAWHIEHRATPRCSRDCRRVALGDKEEELATAVAWAAAKLERQPHSRVAIVVTDLSRRLAELTRLLENAFGAASLAASISASVHCARRALDHPYIGAAMNGIELLSPRGSFTELSRCLRSPFFTGPEVAASAAAASLERDLRTQMLTQVGFLEAFRRAGLAARIERASPELAQRFAAALRVVEHGPRRRSPTQWAVLWQRALKALGLRSAGLGCDASVLHAWERALDEFMELTPIVGELPAAEAQDELRTILARQRRDGPLPLHGLHVLAHVDEIGPGYDAVWVTGLTDRSWPEPGRVNPLLPRTLQRAHGMPWASPDDALRRAEHALERLRARVPELIYSWPSTVYEYRSEPSALILAIEEIERAALEPPVPARGSMTGPQLVSVDDPVPAYAGTTIRGGAQTLDQQSRCPLRAFLQSRLGARPLEPRFRGLPPRLQGIAAHRALELLMRDAHEGADAPRLGGAIEQALGETFRGARGPLQVLFELEQARLEALLELFLESQARRSAYSVAELEWRADLVIAGRELRVRIDRVDRLADGGAAIIDYKTGAQVSRPAWFDERLADTQLPLYMLERGTEVVAAAIVALRGERVRYFGHWVSGVFPDAPMPLPEGRSWTQQQRIWRRQIEALIAEYMAGDARVNLDRAALVQGPYAPLSRVTGLMRRPGRVQA